MDLLNRSRIQKEFEDTRRRRRAAADRAARHRADRLADRSGLPAVAGGDRAARRAPTRPRARGCSAHRTSAPSTPIARALIDSVGREAQRVVDTYDKQREAAAIADQARAAVTTAAAAGGAALGLGTLVTHRGVDGGGRRHRHSDGQRRRRAGLPRHPGAQTEGQGARCRRRCRVARPAGARAARRSSSGRSERGRTRIDDAIAPYSRFVRAERERWTDVKSRLTSLRDQAATFRSRLAA